MEKKNLIKLPCKKFLGIKIKKYRIILKEGYYIAQSWSIEFPVWCNMSFFDENFNFVYSDLIKSLTPPKYEIIVTS